MVGREDLKSYRPKHYAALRSCSMVFRLSGFIILNILLLDIMKTFKKKTKEKQYTLELFPVFQYISNISEEVLYVFIC